MDQTRFRAMGTDCHVLIEAGDPVVEMRFLTAARQRIELLEQCWSRFRPDSELSTMNARAGRGPQPVSEDYLLLVSRMREAWELSGGLFDPTVLTSMTTLGYDTDFDTVAARTATPPTDISLLPAPGMSGIIIDETAMTVALPAGIGLDPGAIGKGLAADVIAEEFQQAGVDGVLVNLGGDISIAGQIDEPWAIGVDDERLPRDRGDRTLRVLEFPLGTDRLGVATSTTLKRRWARGRRHHIIDPRSGAMTHSDLVQVTAVDSTAWQAEITATTALLQESTQARAWLEAHGTPALLLTDHDLRLTTPLAMASDLQEAHRG